MLLEEIDLIQFLVHLGGRSASPESLPKCLSRCWSSLRVTFPTWNGSRRVTPCAWSRWKVSRTDSLALCLHDVSTALCRVCLTNYLHNLTGLSSFLLSFTLFLLLLPAGKKKKTKVINNHLDPEWNEVHGTRGQTQLKSCTLYEEIKVQTRLETKLEIE